jgi:hypothetical protein
MSALDTLKNSTAWNEAYSLPLGTGHGNPHLYLAYVELVLRLRGERVDPIAYLAFYEKCEIEPGLFYRWPDRSFGPTSHDEALGAPRMSELVAKRVLDYLETHDGEYLSHPEKASDKPLRFNLFRMPWLKPYLMACAGRTPNLVSQALWAAKIFISAFKDSDSYRTGPGPRLRAWLMASVMRKHLLCEVAWTFYAWQCRRRGCGLASDLRQEPGWPALAALAPNEYAFPSQAVTEVKE